MVTAITLGVISNIIYFLLGWLLRGFKTTLRLSGVLIKIQEEHQANLCYDCDYVKTRIFWHSASDEEVKNYFNRWHKFPKPSELKGLGEL